MTAAQTQPTMEQSRNAVVDRLRAAWLGPAGGAVELLDQDPVYAYLVGTLYPTEKRTGRTGLAVSTDEDAVVRSDLLPDEETGGDSGMDDEEADDGLDLTSAFGWAPSTMGMSFLHDGGSIAVRVEAALYPVEGDGWRRSPLSPAVVSVPSNDPAGSADVFNGRARVDWRNRRFAGLTLTTVSLANAREVEEGEAKSASADCLFQAAFSCEIAGGDLHPYPEAVSFTRDPEEDELRLRYRGQRTYGVGHGVSVEWDESGSSPTGLRSVTVPVKTVPAIKARESSDTFLRLGVLADRENARSTIVEGLRQFVDEYSAWVEERRQEADTLNDRRAAASLLNKMTSAHERMSEGVALLASDETIFDAFQLANRAMRDQMLRGLPPEPDREPAWRPFQLAFILLSVSSTTSPGHSDRDLVDLIWFPTGGGKTEAYLGLAALEMIRRRLVEPLHGGGTAVLTRYTMRLLTAQQFQRAARLICALELMRLDEPQLRGSAAFSVGLWVGKNATPNTFAQAKERLAQLVGQQRPQNNFQIRDCPWCDTPLVPQERSFDPSAYGFDATNSSFRIHCTRAECPFVERLPVQVVDEAMYAFPPTMVVGTVDKFARLSRLSTAGTLLGLGTQNRPPSLVIQDELHLLSGPLGTVVGTYEAAISAMLSSGGRPPKIVASSATVRAAAEQVRGIFARPRTAVFPPSGLNADDSFFAEPDLERPGRTYVGIMPQAHSPAWALGRLAIEAGLAPDALGLTGAQRSAYWTLVLYHNSLRELGRTVTILRDDVKSDLDRRADLESSAVRSYAVEELNSNVRDSELIELLNRLGEGPDSDGVIDALAATNILSVGIDVDRLGLMLVNGHPKSTSEYIQATSRVGRGTVPGIVITMFRSHKPRDRSVYEGFGPYHDSYYRFVEPASVTPWSLQARHRSLRAAYAMLVRQLSLRQNEAAREYEVDSAVAQQASALILDHIAVADPRELEEAGRELAAAGVEWGRRAATAREKNADLLYESDEPDERLLKNFDESGIGWAAMNSMRTVDAVVRVRAWGEK
ncbi:helicase [Rathayibacter sp. VKM Ac-2929]|uniref:helicase-related protein n=1 Tax=Rathayibacter sp. VKM Ac-2929 TaxID=2929480 RepID=UPI001FB36F56|nr:helicase-related protein [Rathayibacter sp. VKM Ac-2929]MCJ1671847.1 helicase [Rathayibacter sp. VKM Ac-2929]